MKQYEIFGARLLVRRLQDEAAKDEQLVLPALPPGLPQLASLFETSMAQEMTKRQSEFSKGQVISIGKPCESQPEHTDDDALNSSVIGGDHPDRFGFKEVMHEMVGAMAKLQMGGSVMPPVKVGDVVIFPSFRASLLPGETDLFLVGGDAVVARVYLSDFEGQTNG